MLKFRVTITLSIGCSFLDLRVYSPRMAQLFWCRRLWKRRRSERLLV